MPHVRSLTPFVRVADVRRSISWYEALGLKLEVASAPGRDELSRASMVGEGGRMVLALASEEAPAGGGSVAFYAHVQDLDAFCRVLLAKGIAPGPVTDGSPGPRREVRLTDPDGHVVIVAEIEPDPVA